MRLPCPVIVVLVVSACRFDTSGPAFMDGGGGLAVDAARTDDASVADAMFDAADASPALDGPLSVDAAPGDAGSVAGTALLFDGLDDQVAITRQVAGDFTLEAWIKTTSSLTGTQHWQGRGVIHADVSGNANDFGTSILNGHFAFGTGNPDVTIESTTTVTTGAWVHVAATRDRSTGIIRIYVNGTEEAMLATTNTSNLSAASLITLGGNPVDDRYFAGTLDDVRIWSSVRTAAQITASMNSQLAGNIPGLVNYYRLDDGSGTIALDSAHNNDGTLGAGSAAAVPAWVPSGAPIF